MHFRGDGSKNRRTERTALVRGNNLQRAIQHVAAGLHNDLVFPRDAAQRHHVIDGDPLDRVWNLGTISMNYDTYLNGVWKLDFRSASDGFVKEQNMMVDDAETQMLHADISCETVPDGASLTLWLVQGDVSKSFDVTNLSDPLEYSLSEFENGKIHVRLQINGVEDTISEIYVK